MPELEPIYVVGAGAIGAPLAAHLSVAGRDVVVVRASREDMPRGMTEIAVRGADGHEVRATLPMISLDRLTDPRGLIVIAAKSYANPAIAATLARMDSRSPLVVMQNGLDVEEPFLAAGFPEIHRCVIFATGQRLDDGRYSFWTVKPSPIGVIRGSRDVRHHIVQTLSSPAFPFAEDDTIRTTIWQKTIINAVFNSICALLEVDNGIFDRSEQAREVAASVVQECVAVAATQGIELQAEPLLQQVVAISRGSAGQVISTLQDLRRGSRTEIASFNLEIARLGDRAAPPARAERTRLLGQLVQLKAAR